MIHMILTIINYVNTCQILRVVGGKELTSTYYLLSKCSAQSINLSSLDTSKVTGMSRMFDGCEVQSLV